MAEVALENVSKIYANGVAGLRNLSLQVHDGELLVLVGPSGSGKTTALRLIAGLERPTSGTICIDGRPVNDLEPPGRDVGMVFQRHALYPNLNVRENLGFSLKLRKKGRFRRIIGRWFLPGGNEQAGEEDRLVKERVAHAARALGLEEVLDRLPAQLSGGQQQRAALGRVLVRQPAVFLLDEPLSSLDARLRAEMRHELHLLHRQIRATIIYVTHDQVEAMTLGDRIGVLDRGELQQVDRPAVVYDQPRNRFVAGFIGWPPMNFIDGILAVEDGRVRFEGHGWSVPLEGFRAAGCATYGGHPVTLGVRPENLCLAPRGPVGACQVLEVVLVEPLGSDCLVTLGRGGERLLAKTDRTMNLVVGQAVKVGLDVKAVHLFHRSTGLALGAVSTA